MKSGLPRCQDCNTPLPQWGMCKACREQNRLTRLLRLGAAVDEPGKALRVEMYREIVARGGRLFEGGNGA